MKSNLDKLLFKKAKELYYWRMGPSF